MDRQARYTADQLGGVLAAQGRKKRWLAAQVGVHESMIGHVITGRRTASEDLAKRIASSLGLPLFLLFDVHKETDSVSEMNTERSAA